MIRSDKEYQEALAELEEQRQYLAVEEAAVVEEGPDPAEQKRLLDPLRSFQLQLESEIRLYENWKQGNFVGIEDLRDLGRFLIAARIAARLSQRELAALAGVHETQVSRDEHNEYHRITIDRAIRLIELMGADVRILTRMQEQSREPAHP